MTPEERFQKIENYLQAITEHQAEHEERIEKLTASQEKLTASQEKLTASMEKLTVSMERLVDIVGGLADTQDEAQAAHDQARAKHDADIAEIREVQKSTDYKLNALIEIVDRIARKNS